VKAKLAFISVVNKFNLFLFSIKTAEMALALTEIIESQNHFKKSL